ncbi:hypothetical protein [Sphingobacterium thermophilum]
MSKLTDIIPTPALPGSGSFHYTELGIISAEKVEPKLYFSTP